jgi:hypothetical protein
VEEVVLDERNRERVVVVRENSLLLLVLRV